MQVIIQNPKLKNTNMCAKEPVRRYVLPALRSCGVTEEIHLVALSLQYKQACLGLFRLYAFLEEK